MLNKLHQVLTMSSKALVAAILLSLSPTTGDAVRVRAPVVEVELPSIHTNENVSAAFSGAADVLHVTAVRHGESEWNHVCEQGKQTPQILGQFLERYVDSPLSKYGLRQVQRLARIVIEAGRLWVKRNMSAFAFAESDPRLERYAELFDKVDAAVIEMLKVPDQYQAHVARGSNTSNRVSIGSQAENLLANEDALAVLLGEQCENTMLVTSNLVRAIDTGLFLVLPMIFRRSCPDVEWRMSSNLQEIASNRDSETRIPKGQKPKVAEKQRSKYESTGMTKELEYIDEMYTHADASAHTDEPTNSERSDTGAYLARKLDAELTDLFAQKKREVLWGLHSMWIRKFLNRFGDPADETCEFASTRSGKMKNTGILRFDVLKKPWYKNDGERIPFIVTNCRWLLLGEPNVQWTKHLESREDAYYEYSSNSDDALDS